MDDQTFQYRPLETADTFRLLHRIPNAEEPNSTSFKLIHVKLTDIASVGCYGAVSYAWGDTTPARWFRIEEGMCHLPTSSFECLQGLRMLSEYSYFWLDAICINQADLEEKAVQIPLMKQIYSKADIVVIWLGPPRKNSTLALEFLSKAREGLTRKDLNEFHHLEWYLTTTATTTDSPEWEAVAELFCEPWFVRFWCVQEVLLATNKLLAIDGKASCSWSGLHFGRHVLARGIHRYLRVRGRLNEEAAPHLKGIRRLVHDHHYKRKSAFNSFTTVWHQAMSYKATSLVDYVYGVLGLITYEPDGGPAIIPDYGRSDVETFAEAVSLCLRRDNNYDVLSLAGTGFANESTSRRLLPSWIPHFAMKPAPRVLTYRMSRSRYPNRAGLSPHESAESKPDFRFDNARLNVKGVIVDTIDELITDTFLDTRILEDSENDLPAWTVNDGLEER